MSFEEVVGHERPKAIMEKILKGGKLAHGYIFEGPRGVGKTTFALALARRLACEGDKTAACSCRNCRRITGGNHPAIKILSVPEDKQNFPVELVRDEVVEALSYKSMETGWRVFIFNESEKMTPEAANVLLKTLEEPPDYSLLILECQSADQVIETLVSRCHRLRFSSIDTSCVARYLVENHGVDESEATLVARLSGGSIGLALTFHEQRFMDTRSEFLSVLENANPDNVHEAADTLSDIVKASSLVEQRKKIYPLFETLLIDIRDSVSEGGEFSVFESMAGRVEKARKLMEENTNIKLVMLNFVRDFIEVKHANK